MHCSIANRSFRALTLLEVTLALAVSGLLLTAAYGVASGCLRLSAKIDEGQKIEMQRNAFVEFCRQNLRQIPNRAKLTFAAEQAGGNYLSQLALVGAPAAFQFGRSSSEETVLSTELEPGGTLRVRLGELILLRGVGTFEWSLHDALLKEWKPIWEDESRRPDAIALRFGFSGEEPRRYVFWTPKLSRVVVQ